MINIYVLIWGNCSPSLQSEMEGDPDYITHAPTYDFLWLSRKIKMCTSRMYHTSNGYYSSVMYTSNLFYQIQERYKPTEAYYRRFEAVISKAELYKCTETTHTELNIIYLGGDDSDGTRRFHEIRLLMSADSGSFSGVWNY